MKISPATIRKQLLESVSFVASRHEEFCMDPKRNHTRSRKIPFDTNLKIILSLNKSSLQSELFQYFNYDSDLPTKSAFIQQRQKIKHEAFRCLFDTFNESDHRNLLFHGYRLLACDGTEVNLPRNPADKETSAKANPNAKSYNVLHVNALYDLLKCTYTDYTIDLGLAAHESKAMLSMVEKLPEKSKTIIVADRGYGYLHGMYRLETSDLKYVIRVKDILSNNFLASLNLPDSEFDLTFSKIITCSRKKCFRTDPDYLIVNKRGFFDFSENSFYPLSFRVCRFQLPGGSYESLVTNLLPQDFSIDMLKELYHLRWGIETSFRELKYSVGMMYFHARKLNSVLQEIHAAMIMMNFCKRIVHSVPLKQPKSLLYTYKTNFAAAVGLCRAFFSSGKTAVMNLMHMNPSPIRPGRQFARNLHDSKPAKPFSYR